MCYLFGDVLLIAHEESGCLYSGQAVFGGYGKSVFAIMRIMLVPVCHLSVDYGLLLSDVFVFLFWLFRLFKPSLISCLYISA